jgi:hypothetical protein
MRHAVRILLGAVGAIKIATACDNNEDVVCPLYRHRSISVRVFDAVSRNPITGAASGFVTNGQEFDSLQVCDVDDQHRVVTRCAHGTWGVFYVAISAAGFQTWDSTGVVVSHEPCGAITTHLDVNLDRLTSDLVGTESPVALPNSVLQLAAPRRSHR